MKVSIVVPHFNDLASLETCLSALLEQEFPAEDREIIVADNASPQGEAAVAEVIASRARLVVVPEKGAGPARNGGVAAALGEIIAFTDADCVPDPSWLKEGIAALDRLDFVGGRVKVLAPAGRLSQAEAFERVFAFDNEAYVMRKGFTATCNLFCSRAVFDVVGPFGTGVSEDVDWSHRASALNFRLGFAPDAVVRHPARRNWEELRIKWARINAETFALMRRRPGGKMKWTLLSLALPASAVAHSVKVFRSDQLCGFRQRFDALIMLFRLRLWRMFNALSLVVHSSSG